MKPPLADVVVVEYAGSIAGAYCAKMFADFGADVRVVGPDPLSRPHQLYLREHTRSTAGSAADLDAADVVIESAALAPFRPQDIDIADDTVRVQLSHFGATGSRAHWHGSDLIDYALGGHAHLYGDPLREPLPGPPNQPAVAAGLHGFIGAMAALLARTRLGGGQTVDVSHVQVMAALHQFTVLRWQLTGDVLGRMGNRYTGQGQPNGPYRCRDGWVSITCVAQAQIDALLAVTGLTDLLERADLSSFHDLEANPELVDVPLAAWLEERPVAEVVELFQAMRIPAAPLLSPGDLLHDEQLRSRSFFHCPASAPTVELPGSPVSFTSPQPSAGGGWQPGGLEEGPLAGLRVLDLSRVWAGPLCAQMLAQLGAEVIQIEAPWQRGPRELPQAMIDATGYFPDNEAGEQPWNRNGHLIKYALGKSSVAIDLQTPQGQDTFAKLVPTAQVLIENFTPRVMPQLGFNEEQLHGLNPDLLYVTMPGYGRTGPAQNWLAYGTTIDAHAGLSRLIGYDLEEPWKGGVAWPDPIAALHATSAVLAGLFHQQRQRTGGMTIECAQFESMVSAVGGEIAAAQLPAIEATHGSERSAPVLEGVYRCRGDDDWVAISITDRAMYDALVDHLGADGESIASFTALHDAATLAERLQAVGVAAARVAKAPDLVADAHLRSRSGWIHVDQPHVGDFVAASLPIILTKTPAKYPTPAPTLGQHNTEVLTSAGLTTDEIQGLAEASVIVTEPTT